MLLVRSFIGFVLAFCLLGNSVFADDLRSAAGKAVECRSIEDPLERLACLDAAAENLSENLETVPEPVPAPSEDLTIAAPATPEEPNTPTWAQAPEPDVADVAEVSSANNETAEEEKRPLWARIVPRRRNETREDRVIDITIVRITRNNIGRHYFYTENDGVWRQTTPVELRPPGSLPAVATISRSALGSPKLRFEDTGNRAYRVRRVE